jgi:hypothetical protein
MFLGYILANKITFKLPKWAVILDWLLNTTLCLTLIYIIVIPYSDSYEYYDVEAAFFAALHRVAWAVGIGWIIWACVNGYGGIFFILRKSIEFHVFVSGPVNSILSWKYFLPMSKLSYCAFLVHVDVQYHHHGMNRHTTHFNMYEMVTE